MEEETSTCDNNDCGICSLTMLCPAAPYTVYSDDYFAANQLGQSPSATYTLQTSVILASLWSTDSMDIVNPILLLLIVSRILVALAASSAAEEHFRCTK